ncbi:hypothetical protein [Tianweitania sediminis]|uniref:Uncharacterized protein n=1 Tax=Tianweitania sediminis TaxID=1502156 RepID=A0A8J7R5Y7_9HYPH|nr:hypothetical protein [Tianweitania sediminis]MBP0438447.1 hypothetical protein [Tianweitania sediminis]
MNARVSPDEIWKQTISGRKFPLVSFTHEDIDLFGDCAETLARIGRYGGSVQGIPFSVAQHCVIGCDVALEETGDANLAAYFLLHDAHEYVFGDFTTPVAKWLDVLAEDMGMGRVATPLINAAKERLDRAIWKAAGVPVPGKTYRAQVADLDCRMLATERRQLLMPSPASWGAAIENARPIRMRGALKSWSVARSADEYRDRLDRYCPNARRP